MNKYSITCPNCGVENFSNAKVCRNCGQKLPVTRRTHRTAKAWVIKRKRPLGLIVLLVIFSAIMVGTLIKRNNHSNIIAAQYQPYELTIYDRQGKRTAKYFLTYKITKSANKPAHYHGKIIYLTKQQVSKATGGNLQKYFQQKTNYPMSFDGNRRQMTLGTPKGKIQLTQFSGKKITSKHRLAGNSTNAYRYTLKILEYSPQTANSILPLKLVRL